MHACMCMHTCMHVVWRWFDGFAFVDVDSSFVPPLVYAALGSSRGLVVGPVSISSMVMGSTLRQAVNPNTDPYLYLQLAFTSTLIAGIFQLSLGIFRSSI